ncbi:hypothetical protein LOTGIDRAFT_102587 [Lottia gigantea]|uniref:Unconventional myosin-IXb n=1 Tax=Lottia gigantea TaxID=225164 RepID=V4BHU1_LOTGI|nr:hypothetical protein LOTGIDRAFT_102587 [Lottia gigantea]ESP05442.1 hypothetical protein LOTGIDRAFT_102587 [Lottia gigantea]
METYMIRVYTGSLSQESEFVSVEAEKSTASVDITKVAVHKLKKLGNSDNFELAEVFISSGQLCKERRLDPMDTPVGIQLLWPKIINADIDKGQGLLTGYRFYLRKKDPEVSHNSGWMECKDTDTFLMSFLKQPIGNKEYTDLCNLPNLNEKTLLENLKTRFSNNYIYTYVGSILIAVNPFKFFPIYNPKCVKMYQNKRLGELPPHIFAIADAAYYTMLRTKKNQCIVISGESGSGKTESTNLLLHHLTALSHKGLHGSGVEQTILGAGPVLEAFGNAKTVHNNNSSRFGKFIQVNYKENGMVHGAIVEKYLLEKSRIVSQAKNERNYHVFYYLLAGADDSERHSLNLSTPENYNYLSCSDCITLDGTDEKYEFARLKQSMEMVGFSPETQKRIFSVLSAVLHLGNIEFKKKGDQHHDESVSIKNEDDVKIISNLLKVKEKTVIEALTTKKTVAGDETVVINFKMEDAIATRNAMAKCIYGALFDWIVLKVNQALLAKKHNSDHQGNSIGVLDIFGFEDFGNNSYEQFCINYANEHLQYYFNQHIFKFEQEEYTREGIQWKNIEFIDNTRCLELFSSKPKGLFCLLDEECNFPGATNDTLLSKFNHLHKDNLYYEVPVLREQAFVIVHYAGKVKYQIKDFREKNSDHIRTEIVSVLKKSSLSFVRELMGIDPVAVLRWAIVRAFFRCFFAFLDSGKRWRKHGGNKRLSDSQLLQDPNYNDNLLNACHQVNTSSDEDIFYKGHETSCDDDLSVIENHLPKSKARIMRRASKLILKNKSFKPKPRPPSLSFRDIRTLKAISVNTIYGGSVRQSSKKPPSVSAQFQWSLSRLMTTLNQANPFFIRCIKSNSEKLPCTFDEEIVLRQSIITFSMILLNITGYSFDILISVFQEFIQLYKILLPRGLLSSKEDVKIFLEHMTFSLEHYQIGKDKVFLRETEKMLLDEALHRAIMERVVRIQRWMKTIIERQLFVKLRWASLILQKYVRRFLAVKKLHQLRNEEFAAVTIQRWYRGYRVRSFYHFTRNMVILIQAQVRTFIDRKRLLDMCFICEVDSQKPGLSQGHGELKRILTISMTTFCLHNYFTAIIVHLKLVQEKERQRIIEEEHRRREIKKHHEDMQSSASDEGVLMKGSSAEELEQVEESTDGRSVLIRRGSQRWKPRPADSPTTPTETSKPSGISVVSPEQLKNIESAVSKGRDKPENHLDPDKNLEVSQKSHKAMFQNLKNFLAGNYITFGTLKSFCCNVKINSKLFLASKVLNAALRNSETISKLTYQVQIVLYRGIKYLPIILYELKHHIQNITERAKKRKDESDEEEESSKKPTECKLPFKWQNDFIWGTTVRVCLPSTIDLTPITRKKESVILKGIVNCFSKFFMCIVEESIKAGWNRKKKRRQRSSQKVTSQDPQPTWSVAGTSQWQYPAELVITDLNEIMALDEFISKKYMELFKDSEKRSYTIFDKIFKGAIEDFRRDLKTLIGLFLFFQRDEVCVKYRDLLSNFEQVLKAGVIRERTTATFPVTMGINAFHAFLDGFMKAQPKKKEKKEEKKTETKAVKKDKNKKDCTMDHLGHKFLQVQFNIPTFCELCSSLIWIMEKGQVCQICKYTCHKKCCSKSSSACKGTLDNRGSSGSVMNVPLQSLLAPNEKVPNIIEKLISVIEIQGLFIVGIYRKCGSAPKVRALLQEIDSDQNNVKLEDYPVHVLCTVLKRFFRDLPEPLMTFDLYDEFLMAADIKDDKERIQTFSSVIASLPKPNFDLFERLIFHLARVAMHEDSNMMNAQALAIIFAPCLLRSNKNLQAQDCLKQVPKQNICLENIISERLKKLKATLSDINTLESAEKTATDRLTYLRASIRSPVSNLQLIYPVQRVHSLCS